MPFDVGNDRPPGKCNCRYCHFGLKLPIHSNFWGFGGHISPKYGRPPFDPPLPRWQLGVVVSVVGRMKEVNRHRARLVHDRCPGMRVNHL